MKGDLTVALQAFTKDRKFNRKGPLSVALVLTQHARKMGLPLDAEQLLTEGGGQVLGLGKSAVQAIDKAASKGVIKKGTASRSVSRLTIAVSGASAAK